MKTNLFDMVNKDNIFTVITADQAVEYTGKEVYVANSITALEQQIKEGFIHTLEGINSNLCELRFNVHSDDCTTDAYALCVPADKVHKIEKKLRPFKTFEEFKTCIHRDIGDVIVFKEKNAEPINITLITGYHGSCLYKLGLGCMSYSFQELFYNYLYLDSNNEWKFFGIEE